MAKTKIKVKLIGEDGNAYAILGKVKQALKQEHPELVEEYVEKAMAGTYDDLLITTMEYVEVE